MTLPFPDTLALKLVAYVPGKVSNPKLNRAGCSLPMENTIILHFKVVGI